MNASQRLNALRREADRLNAMRAALPARTWRDARYRTLASPSPAYYRSPAAGTIAAEEDAV